MTWPIAPQSIRPALNLGSLELCGNRFQSAGKLLEGFGELLLDHGARRRPVALQAIELDAGLVQLVVDQQAGHQQQPALARRAAGLDQLADAAVEAAGELAQMLLLPGVAGHLVVAAIDRDLHAWHVSSRARS